MEEIKLYRRRFIPDELVPLIDDIVLLHEDHLIITKWNTLNPRKDIARGLSAYYLNEGYKVSKVYNHNDQIVYWYCDLIQTKKDADNKEIIFEDLLIDVIVYEDGRVHIVDLDELADALDSNLITPDEGKKALRILNKLLKLIYQGHFDLLKEPVNKAEII